MKKSNKQLLIISTLVLSVLGLAVFVYTTSTPGEKPRRNNNKMQQVRLVAPPPPPKIKELPPEPQEVKQEKIKEQLADLGPNTPDNPADNTPPAKDLGVDAEGSAGSDGFGLQGRKGGRGLLAGGGGGGTGYGWYTNQMSIGLQRMVNEIIQKEGGLPEGKWRTVVKIELDVTGKIKTFSIIGSSGNQKLDAAVNKALASANLNESLPPGMPRIMKLSFTI